MISKYKIPLISKNKIGFRLSKIDIYFILLALIVSYIFTKYLLIYPVPGINKYFLSLITLYIVTNFFLFCNVFRVNNKYEIYWLIIGTINIILDILYYQNVIVFFLIQSLFTILIILLEIKSVNYHGVFAKKINNIRKNK